MDNPLPEAFLERLKAVIKKRPKTVIDHILGHGFITTEELKSLYGYNHAPRAARDVREEGIPLETFRVKNAEGRSIGAYKFADPTKIRADRLGGRQVFPKAFKDTLVEANQSRCHICLETYVDRYLQVDHRVPYEIAGDVLSGERKSADYMLLCGSCNRAKSWSCEHCPNFTEAKDSRLCESCYWASPEGYRHIALQEVRRIELIWTSQEVETYEHLRRRARRMQRTIPQYVKAIIQKHLDSDT